MSLSKEDLTKVRKFLLPVRLKWYDIGLELSIKDEELDEIEAKYYRDFKTCLREMLKIRLRCIDNPLTWKEVAKALKSKAIDEQALALKGKMLNCFIGKDFI